MSDTPDHPLLPPESVESRWEREHMNSCRYWSYDTDGCELGAEWCNPKCPKILRYMTTYASMILEADYLEDKRLKENDDAESNVDG